MAAIINTALLPPKLLSWTLRRAPFAIFSKRAPLTLPQYSADSDFQYYFVSDYLQHASGRSHASFFVNHRRRQPSRESSPMTELQVRNDISVGLDYPFPAIKTTTESWRTPARTTIIELRQTCVQTGPHGEGKGPSAAEAAVSTGTQERELFLLGCWSPHDDVEMGMTSFCATTLPPSVQDEAERVHSHIPESWYLRVFDELPMAIRIFKEEEDKDNRKDRLVMANQLARKDFAMDGMKTALERSQQLLLHHPSSSSSQSSSPYYYDAFHIGGLNYRLWIWRIVLPKEKDDDQSYLAVAYRPKHHVMPELVEDSLSSSLSSMMDDEDQ